MIRRLSIFDTDEFVDLVNDAFKKELQYLGERYGTSKGGMKMTYVGMRLLQKVFGDIRDLPDIFAYYDEEGELLGITELIPVNARKNHWHSLMTAVNPDVRRKGVANTLKEHTIAYYTGKADRFLGNLREENVASLKANMKVGYRPYVRKMLLRKAAPHLGGGEGVSGLRHFHHDERGVFDLYVKKTPDEVRKVEQRAPEDFRHGTVMKLFWLLRRIQGERDKKFVIEKEGRITGYLYFERLWLDFENLEILLDPSCEIPDLTSVLSSFSPHKNIISYLPEYCDVERKALLEAGFAEGEVYLGVAREFESGVV